jgi:competence protein ComEC
VPAFGVAAVALLSLALLLATLMVSPLRWLGLVPASLGLWLAATPKKFDLYLDRTGVGAAVRGAEGKLVLIGRSSGFTAEQWLKADGDARRASDPSLRAGSRCDPLGCVAASFNGRVIALAQDRRALVEDCARAEILLTRLRAPPSCAAAVVIDGRFLAAHGATAIRFTESGHEIATARTAAEGRPWRRAPEPVAQPPPGTGPSRLMRGRRGEPPDQRDDAPLSSDEPG